MVAVRNKTATVAAAPAAAPKPARAPKAQPKADPPPNPDTPEPKPWGAFSTDTANGEPKEPLIPAEDTEAAKVATAKATKGRSAKNKAPEAKAEDTVLNTTALVKFVERIERKQEEISVMKEDLKEIFVEVKAKGYKSAILRKVLTRRAVDPEKLKELDAMVDLYEEALRGV